MSSIPNTTNLNVRVDATLKQESDALFKNLGLNMSTAINMAFLLGTLNPYTFIGISNNSNNIFFIDTSINIIK